ncbi:hypothetical protein CBS101457_005299 [Exobasidium rhododendri]|nr:hypothetical protein CBS101457_005299 [Exobasidium rhododendri]
MTTDGVARGLGLGNGFSTKNTIKMTVSLSDVDVLLYPSEIDIGGGPIQHDQRATTVIVHIALIVPLQVTPPDSIAALIVELKSDETLGFPSGVFERNTPHQVRKVVDSAKALQLHSGNEYQWDVPIEIEAVTAPYERGSYGRLFHKITVTLEWPGLSGWWKAGKSLVVEKPVFLASVPLSTNVLSYARTHNGFSENVGPVILHTRSRQLSVGGYLRIALNLPGATPDIHLLKLVLTIIQDTKIVSRKEPEHVEMCVPKRVKFFEVEGEELQGRIKRAEGGSEVDTLNAEWIARLPKDDKIRSSTLQGNEASIRHHHLLEVALTYKSPQSKDEVLSYTSSWPILLPSCSATWRRIKLPTYSMNDPSPVPEFGRDSWEPDKYKNVHVSQTTCACGQSLEKLLSWEDEGDDEDNTSTSRMMREAVRSASSSFELERQSRSRSRSRQRSGLRRDASARPSLHSHPTTDEEPDDGMDEVDEELEREIQARRKTAQLYTSTPDT